MILTLIYIAVSNAFLLPSGEDFQHMHKSFYHFSLTPLPTVNRKTIMPPGKGKVSIATYA